MDHKNHQPSIDSSPSFPTTTNRDHYLKQLNKLSHSISKPNHTFNKHALPESQPQAHVYNISKSDFRDMVQKLTGSPGHDQQPKPAHPVSSSRLHRLRPPPLPQIATPRRLPQSGNVAVAPPSPLPPFPTVHAESPVSAYMRFLRNPMPSSSYSSESEFQMPSSPFGCFNSLGCSQVPLSPTVPVSSPAWRDL